MSDHSWLKGRTVVYNPVPRAPSKPKRFRIGRILWTALKRTCMVIGAVVLFSAVIGVWSAMHAGKKSIPVLPDQMILTLSLDGRIPEESGMSQYLALLNIRDEPLTFNVLIDSIEKAITDERVKALALNVSSTGYDISQLQEIRKAVLTFKKSGKKTYIYSESYGGSGYGLGLYYLASAFDEIWMQPVGVVAIGGISADMPFFKDVMEKYGVEAQFFQRKEYKNAMEHLTSSKMSMASREETQGLIDSMATQLIEPIKAERKQISKTFDGLLNLGMLTDEEALKSGLIDKMDYEDSLFAELDKTYGDIDAVSVDTYSRVAQRDRLMGSKKASVAIIHVEGMIVSGRGGGGSPYSMEDSMVGADDIADSIKTAARNKRIKAIVLRVNSPGGSPSASETIARAVHWARVIKRKPVYVSMGSVAASGGYWISTEATKIYAMDATLTGSIGVVGGKINLQKLWEKYDVNWERVSYGKNSSMMSMNTPFSASEQKQFELTLDNVYDHFILRVAKGRSLTPAQVEAIAKGHVWTGREAKEKGLVDEIGGLNDVLDLIAKNNSLASRHELTILHLPSADNPLAVLFELLSSEASLPAWLGNALSSVQLMSHSPRLVMDSSLPQVRG
ncbi:MAG: signal peptide peptidase SppA [Alphaproteobacteria bacterium CG1_02_46_17]|nr:MAG: signal peptide peptidase SppA [Alphaproteobacteria bacterium CG1_02_46_17]